ncbi:MAG: DNA-binding response regulator, partial [Actinobacteria bacterium]|nr:DNA-binding response regulator [Actinomycetota bacterium]
MTRVMVVEDDRDISEMLSIVLNEAGIDVDLVDRGDQVISTFRTNPPDLVLLDLMLPGKDGVSVCQELRNESLVPIVMLTAKSETSDVVKGLEAGADDYMVKPFNGQELLARIRTRLRRSQGNSKLKICDIEIDQLSHTITRAGKSIILTRLEFELLVTLAKEPGRVFTREALLKEVWGYSLP